jgi:hypothetical protein
MKTSGAYADWRLSEFNITKQSTIWVEWKFLQLLYKRFAGEKMDEIVGEQVSEVSPAVDRATLTFPLTGTVVHHGAVNGRM